MFFDSAGIKYQYEPEGFVLEDGAKYLPDFYLPDVKGRAGENGLWVEVKGVMTDEAFKKMELFSGECSEGTYTLCRPIIAVGNIPLNALECGINSDESRLYWNALTVDCDDYHVHFYKQDDGTVGLYGWDNVDNFSGFDFFNNAFEKARQARFEYGECG